MVECFWCNHTFDGTYYRWLCPNCGHKLSCCEGAPCPTPLYDISDVAGRPE